MPFIMPAEEPQRPSEDSKGRPSGQRDVQVFKRWVLEAEGIVDDTANRAKDISGTNERPTVRLEDLNFPELDDDDQDAVIPPEQERRDFERIDRVVMKLLDLISEPIALFGSHALFRFRRGSSRIPADSDIATTPKGAYDLRRALEGRDDVKIVIEPYIHNPEGPLKAIRFAGKVIVEGGKEHPFEVFGEGGEFNGETFKGLFRLGDPGVRTKAVMTEKLIRAGFLLESYERLIDEIERTHPSDRFTREKWERRRTRIKELKKDLINPKRMDRGELKETLGEGEIE